MTELYVGKCTGAESLGVYIHVYIYRKHIWNELQTYCDCRFNKVVHFMFFNTPYDQIVEPIANEPH